MIAAAFTLAEWNERSTNELREAASKANQLQLSSPAARDEELELSLSFLFFLFFFSLLVWWGLPAFFSLIKEDEQLNSNSPIHSINQLIWLNWWVCELMEVKLNEAAPFFNEWVGYEPEAPLPRANCAPFIPWIPLHLPWAIKLNWREKKRLVLFLLKWRRKVELKRSLNELVAGRQTHNLSRRN